MNVCMTEVKGFLLLQARVLLFPLPTHVLLTFYAPLVYRQIHMTMYNHFCITLHCVFRV